MTATKDPTKLKLSHGKGTPESPCLMSKASLVHAHQHGYLDTSDVAEVFTDSPCWADPIVRPLVVLVNDSIDQDDVESWERLDGLMPRILSATKISDPKIEKRVHARVLCQQARLVLHLFEDRFPDDSRPRQAIEAREAWLNEDGGGAHAPGAAYAANVAYAAGAAYAANALDAPAAADAAYAASAVAAADAAGAAGFDGIQWLADFLDQLDKAKAEEGAMPDDGWIDTLKSNGFAIDTETGLL